jgi:hypothetical protein
MRGEVERLENLYGLADCGEQRQNAFGRIFEKVASNHRSLFVCRRGDLLSGSVARILQLMRIQALFVDRIVIHSVLGSSVTVFGEDLSAGISTPPIRRFDVFKAFCILLNILLTSAAFYPLLPRATQYAMSALKASVHSCYFCHCSRRAPLEEEIDFFLQRYGSSSALEQLPRLRRAPVRSYAFVWSCVPAMARLHLRTARALSSRV